MGAESLGPTNYTIKRERGRRRRGADLREQITRPEAKWAVGAPRALISSEGRGIPRPRQLHSQKGKGPSAEGGLDYPTPRENYTIEREWGSRRAACSYLL